jgi:hypothetical protein
MKLKLTLFALCLPGLLILCLLDWFCERFNVLRRPPWTSGDTMGFKFLQAEMMGHINKKYPKKEQQ